MTESLEPRRFVPVYSAYGQLAGEIVRLMLETKGIPAILTQESVGASFGLTFGRLGIATIRVPEDRQEEAETILQAMEDGRLEAPNLYEQTQTEYKYRSNKFQPSENIKDLDE